MLQVYKFCKYEPPLTRILIMHFAKVFNSLSQTLKSLYVYRYLYKETLLVNMRMKKLCRKRSVIP